jgi:predicted acyl esterase
MGQPRRRANRRDAMNTAWRLPEPGLLRELQGLHVTMPDGVRLALDLWLPDGGIPAPVVLESIPYRKGDLTRAYSRFWGRSLAQYGVGYARLDIRGSGDSEGVLTDEYTPQEQADAAAIIAWLAAQPWCNGSVGMRGVSWGGFAALQTAALAPPALKAIMPMCCSDRRFTDDAHFVGGVFALTGLKWATSFKLVMAGPPDPESFGAAWESTWRERLDACPPIAAEWLARQREDAYWRQGSVFHDPGAITCPVYLVGGWADPYNEAIPRLLERLDVPAKALIGPWAHGYPWPATPGPALDWTYEEVRWWRHWLAGEETGIMDGPKLWAYLPDAAPAQVSGELPGRWVAGPNWPPRTRTLTFGLTPGQLVEDARGAGTLRIESDRVVGLAMPEWCPSTRPQLPALQSADDVLSLTLDGEPLAEPLELFGATVLRLRLAADRPVATLAARLTEVTGDGSSWLVTWGALNLTRRHGPASAAPLAPGAFIDVELPLKLTARRLAAGSRLRLALSGSLWPLLWPSPEPADLTIDLAHASLDLPVRVAAWNEPAFEIPLAPGAPDDPAGHALLKSRSDGRDATFEETASPSRFTVRDRDLHVERSGADVTCQMTRGGDNRWRVTQGTAWRRGEWACAVEAEVELTADAEAFHIRERLVARLGGAVTFEREHAARVPRDLM